MNVTSPYLTAASSSQPPDITGTTPDQPTVTLSNPPATGDQIILQDEQDQIRGESTDGPSTGPHMDQLIKSIGSMQNPIERNQAISGSYHDIGLQLHHMLGSDSGVNWASWASFASNSVGHNMRGQATGGQASSWFGSALGHIPFAGLGISDSQKQALGRGNQIVYNDIAPRMESFIKTFGNDKSLDMKKYTNWANQNLKEPDPKTKKLTVDPDMDAGFLAYYRAKFDTNSHQKDEDMLMGNCEIGLHEQKLLQPSISQAVNGGHFDNQQKTQEMGLILPGGTLQLASDVPSYQGQDFPSTLQHMDGPLKPLFDGLVHNPGTLNGSGAHDWSNLHDRMNFIANLFASRQHDDDIVFDVPDLVG